MLFSPAGQAEPSLGALGCCSHGHVVWPGPRDAVGLGGECPRPRVAGVSDASLGNSAWDAAVCLLSVTLCPG